MGKTAKQKQDEPRLKLGAATPAKDQHGDEPVGPAAGALDHERVQRSIPIILDGEKIATLQLVVGLTRDEGGEPARDLPTVSYGITDHRS